MGRLVDVVNKIVGCMGDFFFSSRRRHTRLQGDWSSDVCSSDLGTEGSKGSLFRNGWFQWFSV